MSYRRKASPKKTAGALDPERFKAEVTRPGIYQVIPEKNKTEQRGEGKCCLSLESEEHPCSMETWTKLARTLRV
jgi:hypothetical protein